MPSPRLGAQARRTVERLHRGLGEDAPRLREDAGLTRAALAGASGVDATYLARIEDGLANPSLDAYARIAAVLGADFGAHLYPNTGPTIRDRHQARIVEWLTEQAHPRWSRFIEIPVRNPARGWIDMALHDPVEASLVAIEVQSTLGRLEQLLRWSRDKVASLPSWEGHAHLGRIATTSSVLVVRSTRATREIGRTFERQLEVAFPAHPQDAIAALTGTRPWPGAALIWIDLRPNSVRFIGHR